MTVPTALRVPATAALLDAWESGLGGDPADRALPVLALMCGDDRDLDDCALGEWNRLSLRARALLFGASADTVADCPDCGAQLEASIPLTELISGEPADAGEAVLDAYGVRYRLPTRRDLGAVADLPVEQAARRLLARCVLSIRSGGEELSVDELPEELADAMDAAISAADPDAVLEAALTCPDCGDAVRLSLDPASFLWHEVDRWALRVLAEVAELAAVFGWSEDAIVALSPWRRQMYLSLAGRWS
ncbi:hypothetical protein DFR70_10917 [Nocardia tenerifensis]|uniref:Phage baseplate protein n=1 Tax=Nocardia tenerifensis TaxID=228006 RepID=A0A318K0D0_9NOCA|nr:hypothetical protein [Nocardia tenerifensis]PXX60826.1 hypothetical protein DFR70_10917 [Nocardia tenerifensis]